MKTILRNVYYCDHCKKRYMQPHACLNHEKGCTANIERECFMCDMEGIKNDIPALLKTYEGKKPTIDEIRIDVDGCPLCMLTVIRKLKINEHYIWEFKTELDRFWTQRDNSY